MSTKQRIPGSAHFVHREGVLHADSVPLDEIADHVGTPTYVYSAAAIHDAYRSVDASLAEVPHMVAYAVKANSNLSLLSRLGQWGSCADIVSGGELARARKAGFAPEKIVFSGVGKTDAEIREALEGGVRSLNAESLGEIDTIERIAAELGVVAPIALRVNPDVDAATHPYISTGLRSSKFGIDLEQARALVPRLVKSKHVKLEGVACHIGSMVLSPEPIGDAIAITAAFAAECVSRGAPIKSIDAGGGWPILYGNEEATAQSHAVFGRALIDGIRRGGAAGLGLTLVVEPGRALVGDAGVLLTRVLYVKEHSDKRFIVVDGAMTELIRPALYRAYHAIVPVEANPHALETPADVVGPVCESADFFAQDRAMPPVKRGDLLAIRGAGAYASVMGSNYNSRPLAPEVLVEDGGFSVVRVRQTYKDLWAQERGHE